MAIPFSLPTQRCFLRTTRIPQISRTFLCLRRGVSPWTALPCLLIRFSLPTQRCFRLSHMDRATANLFSAYAEVFPRDEKSGIRSTTFLCLRRGVSHFPRRSPADPLFSLPTQRCFPSIEPQPGDEVLFSAYAEVFPRCTGRTTPLVTFLCLRRGVSPLPAVQEVQRLFSLPTQRCFRIQILKLRSKKLFSAYAEVFPPRDLTVVELVAFLCLRRGVSQAFDQPITPPGFSLPTQRCFYV